jgi:UDP-N-acetylglucosamine:LPS N-acetylglucosamine transferase
VRILIFTASVGEGHDLPARTLTAQLLAEAPGVEVVVRDGLQPMGRLISAVSESAPRVVFFRVEWIWDAAFMFFAGFGPTRRLTQELLGLAGSRGLLRVVREVDPDIVVSTYPQTTEVLGRLRRRGALDIPVCSAITDLAALHYWAAEGVDVHLVTHPESIEEVRSIAGPRTKIHCVHGLTRPEFVEPISVANARRELDLPASGKIVLVSGGGWGVGDLEGAVEEALSVDQVTLVVCLCGRNETLQANLERAYADDARVRVSGFTERIGNWLAASDALVHSTGGLTILEAHIRGCPAISYGWARGHLRVHDQAFRRFGLAEVASSRDELRSALRRALEARPAPDLSFANLPSAASIVLAYAGFL